MNVLVLNSGSSSQKSSLYAVSDPPPEDPPAPLWQAEIEWRGTKASLRVQTARGVSLDEQVSASERQSAIEQMLQTLWSGRTAVLGADTHIEAVGHRIVHGGHKFAEATVVTSEVKSVIASVSAFAPLHNRAELEGISIVERLIANVPQVVVFDTGFHRSIPLCAAVYPGPYSWFQQGIRRYGFHGINHQYCAERAAKLLRRPLSSLKLVCCHLGNGCSLAAIDGGRSVDTTMGFTPLDGLMMGTRSGSVDPSILTYLMRQGSVSGEEIDQMLNQQSGLLGISGISEDMRDVLAAIGKGNARAKLAFDMFVHRLAASIAAMAASLAGLDVLVFTAGIGEHSAEVRAAACQKLGFLGLELDSAKNAESPEDQAISSESSRVTILIIHAEEDWAIAKASAALLLKGDERT